MNGRVDGNYSTRLLVKLQGLGNIHSESGLWDVIHQAWNIKRTLIPPLLFVRSGNKKIPNTWKTWKWKVCRWCQVHNSELNALLASLAFHFNLMGFLKASAKKNQNTFFWVGMSDPLPFRHVSPFTLLWKYGRKKYILQGIRIKELVK